MSLHQSLCKFRNVKCEGCKVPLIFQEVESHIKTCSGLNYTCHDCGYSCKGHENKKHSCFKYFEYIFSEKMKIAVANGLSSIKAENDSKYNELKSYFDFLKGEVARIDEDLKSLRMNNYLKDLNKSNIDQNDYLEKDLEMFNRCLDNVNLEELNKSALELGVATYEKNVNTNLTKDINLDSPKKDLEEKQKNERKFTSDIYFHQELKEEQQIQNSQLKARGTLVKGDVNSENLKIILSLEKEEEYNTGTSEAIKCLTFLDNLDQYENADQQIILITGHNLGSIIIWDLSLCKIIKSYKEHSNSVWCLKSMPQLKGMFASASIDQIIKIWDIKSDISIKTIKSDCPVYCIEPISGFKKFYLASGGSNKNLVIWDIKNKQKLMSREVERRHDIDKLLFLSKINQNGKTNLILCVNFKTVRLYNLTTLSKEQEFKGHDDSINGIAYLKDDKFVTSSSDGTIKLWSIHKEGSIKTISLHSGNIGGLINFPLCEGIFLSASNDKILNIIYTNESNEHSVLKKNVLNKEVDGMVLIDHPKLFALAFFNKSTSSKFFLLK